jgi:putative transposase
MTHNESAIDDIAACLQGTDASLTSSIADILAAALQELIEAELTATIGAEPGERNPARTAQRNGHRPKLLSTPAGDLEVGIPKLRKGSFFPELLEPRRRIDKALWAVIMTAYITGTSTRKVDELVKALGCDTEISKSSVSQICKGIDVDVAALRTRRLDHQPFFYVWLNATYYVHVHVRDSGQVVSKAVVIATGLRADGHREVLGVDLGDSENDTFWTEFLRDLKDRGLAGGAAGDLRCARPAQGRHPQGPAEQQLAKVSGACDAQPARRRPCPAPHRDLRADPHHLRPIRPRHRRRPAPRRGRPVDPDRPHRRGAAPGHGRRPAGLHRLPAGAPVQDLVQQPDRTALRELKRRADVVQIFPNTESVIRLVGALLVEMNDEMIAADRRYIAAGSVAALLDDHDRLPSLPAAPRT